MEFSTLIEAKEKELKVLMAQIKTITDQQSALAQRRHQLWNEALRIDGYISAIKDIIKG